MRRDGGDPGARPRRRGRPTGLVDACGATGEQSWLCSTVYRITGDAHAADDRRRPRRSRSASSSILARRVDRWCGSRACSIRRLVEARCSGERRASSASTHGACRSLDTSADAAASRRAQRAETIGAVLRSIVAVADLGDRGAHGPRRARRQPGPLIAGAGIVGVALGFGAQSLVTRLPLRASSCHRGPVRRRRRDRHRRRATGTVEGVSLRTTRLRDVEGVVWHVPNGEIRASATSRSSGRARCSTSPVALRRRRRRATEVIRDRRRRGVARPASSPSIILAEPERARASSRWRPTTS